MKLKKAQIVTSNKKAEKIKEKQIKELEKKEAKEKKRIEKEKRIAEKKEKKYVKKNGPKYEKYSIDKFVPLIRKFPDTQLYEMEDGTLLAIYGVIEKNLLGAPEGEIARDNLSWDKLYKTYSDDIKIVTSNFPTDTRRQIEYYEHLIQTQETKPNINPVFKNLLLQKKEELKWISENRHEKNASLFIYCESIDDYREKDRRIRSVLSGLVYTYDPDTELKIIYMLYNKTEAL